MKSGNNYLCIYNRRMNDIFNHLFVLELANNHWGSLARGKRIVREFATIIKKHNVKAAIKLQFRDVDTFIHKDFTNSTKKNYSRYIDKTLNTKLSNVDFEKLLKYIKKYGCITMSTPFDEKSVDFCVKLDVDIIKIASSDINDWILIKKIAKAKKPVIISTGGASEIQIETVVTYFKNRNIPISINHCVSNYPSEDHELELNQIDFLKNKYPDCVIGLSTHEYNDWHSSMLISYAKGVRTWERHIDIPYKDGEPQKEVSLYCSTPEQVDEWFSYYKKAISMCGTSKNERRTISNKENLYLQALHRGLYLKKDLPIDTVITIDNLYSAVPFQPDKNQFSSRTFIEGDYILNKNLKQDDPITFNDIK